MRQYVFVKLECLRGTYDQIHMSLRSEWN